MDKIRVLIADDTKETVDLVRKVIDIEQDNFEIVGEASNGEEVLELVTTTKPDIVLMDINMPIMNGLEATEKITSDFPAVAVVIMSVQGENEYLRKAMLCGAKEYIVKPFNYNTLLETIKVTYEKNKEARELELLQRSAYEEISILHEEEENELLEDLLDEYPKEDESHDEVGEIDQGISNEINLNVHRGFRAVSISVIGGSGISYMVKPGHFVDVLVFLNDAIHKQAITRGISRMILQNIKVLGIEKQMSSDTYVTLSVPMEDLEKLVLAENIGRLKLVIRPEKDNNKKNSRVATWEDISGQIDNQQKEQGIVRE